MSEHEQTELSRAERLGRALAAWRAALGEEHVIVDEAARARAATATFPTTQTVAAILRPGRREEVEECLRIATAHRCPVYPVSGGRNWGYGSQVPSASGSALLHLGRLDRIVDLDEELACVTVEAGVTFRQLHAFLEERKSGLYMSAIGGPPDASVLANALERGDGAGPLGDRFAHVCGLEVVLPTGACVHTGFGRFAGARAAPVGRWGVGPFLDGLFSQSSLGVVTRLSLWLAPLPRFFQLGFYTLDDGQRLPSLVDALRRLRLAGILRGPCALWNDYKALTLVGQYPWEPAGGEVPLAGSLVEEWKQRAAVGTWNGTLAMPAESLDLGWAERELVEKGLGAVVDRLEWTPLSPVAEMAAEERGPSLGVPHERSVASLYWRKKTPVPPVLAPEADRCGFLWITPAMPFAGRAVAEAVAILDEEMRRGGFEPAIALVGVTERIVYAVAAIMYDREVPGDDQRALACHDHALARLAAAGFHPFRLGRQSMDALPPSRDATDALLRALKEALDPAHVLAPGQYEPRR